MVYMLSLLDKDFFVYFFTGISMHNFNFWPFLLAVFESRIGREKENRKAKMNEIETEFVTFSFPYLSPQILDPNTAQG